MAMKKSELLRKKLHESGYREMTFAGGQLVLHYRNTDMGAVGILIDWTDEKGVPDRDFLLRVGQEAYQELEMQGGSPRLLFLLAGSQMDRYRALAEQIPGCWLWDTGSGRLFIYENQPGQFYGLERLLEQIDREMSVQSERSGTAGGWKRARSSGQQGSFLTRRADGKPRAFVNTTIVIINIAVFLVMELFGSTENASYMVEHGASYAPYIYYGKEYYRLFTAMFLHFGISHLANNMLVLFFLGDNVERAVGHWKYLVIYLLSGLAGSGLSFAHAMLSGDYAVSVGASGAIFGVIGALFYIVARNRGRLEDMTTRRLGFLIFISLYHGITGSGVDNYAHVGGLIGGILSALVLYCRE